VDAWSDRKYRHMREVMISMCRMLLKLSETTMRQHRNIKGVIQIHRTKRNMREQKKSNDFIYMSYNRHKYHMYSITELTLSSK
jgi:hypothetical protein